MAQQIINYDEEMVGANHPTKSDTLNRGFLVSHAENGGIRNGMSFPTSGLEDRMAFYRVDLDRLFIYDLASFRGHDTVADFGHGRDQQRNIDHLDLGRLFLCCFIRFESGIFGS